MNIHLLDRAIGDMTHALQLSHVHPDEAAGHLREAAYIGCDVLRTLYGDPPFRDEVAQVVSLRQENVPEVYRTLRSLPHFLDFLQAQHRVFLETFNPPLSATTAESVFLEAHRAFKRLSNPLSESDGAEHLFETPEQVWEHIAALRDLACDRYARLEDERLEAKLRRQRLAEMGAVRSGLIGIATVGVAAAAFPVAGPLAAISAGLGGLILGNAGSLAKRLLGPAEPPSRDFDY